MKYWSLFLLWDLAFGLSSTSPQDPLAYPKYEVIIDHSTSVSQESVDMLVEDSFHIMRNYSTGVTYVCALPDNVDDGGRELSPEHSLKDDTESGIAKGLQILSSLKNKCLYLREGWFTYSFCYNNKIRQFHETRTSRQSNSGVPQEDETVDSYTLGVAPNFSSQQTRVPQNILSMGRSAERETALDVGHVQETHYLSQIWDLGTLCDQTLEPRRVEVQYHCNTQTSDRIALVRETSVCSYLMIIHTPKLCSVPLFLQGHDDSHDPTNKIVCHPLDDRVFRGLVLDEGTSPPPPPPDIHLRVSQWTTDPSLLRFRPVRVGYEELLNGDSAVKEYFTEELLTEFAARGFDPETVSDDVYNSMAQFVLERIYEDQGVSFDREYSQEEMDHFTQTGHMPSNDNDGSASGDDDSASESEDVADRHTGPYSYLRKTANSLKLEKLFAQGETSDDKTEKQGARQGAE